INFFWLVSLVPVFARDWSGPGFWSYTLLCSFAGALPLTLASHGGGWAGACAVVFGLLVAWDRLYGRERVLLLGIGELSVRQAAVVVALIYTTILFLCNGWFVTVAMLCGGVAGWIYFLVQGKRVLRGSARVLNSDRMARLEL